MEHSDDPQTEFKRKFATRRRRQLLLLIPVLPVLILLVSSEGKEVVLGMPSTIVVPGAVALVLVAVAFSLYNWRCPACRKYLGKSINPRFCFKCGVGLS